MEKKKYYVSVASGEISQIKVGNNADFTIHATEGEVTMLRTKFDKMNVADFDSFWRSHVPIIPYHHDSANDRYDSSIMEVYQILYNLGDDDVRDHIHQIGILTDKPIKSDD